MLQVGAKIPKHLQEIVELKKTDEHLQGLRDEVKKYFTQLEKTALLKLKQLYFWDFKLYGYTFDLNTLEIGGFE